MAKKNSEKRRKRREEERKKDHELVVESSFSNEVHKLLKVLLGVIIFLGVFYLITNLVLNKDEKKTDEKVETTIQYDEILAGSSFAMKPEKYLVVYYDFTDEELSELASKVYDYTYSGEKTIYTVDMSNGFNKSFVKEKANTNPTKASELAINGPTLIYFKEGKVSKYIEGSKDIIDYLG